MVSNESFIICISVIVAVFFLYTDGHCSCRRKHSKKQKCPQPTEPHSISPVTLSSPLPPTTSSYLWNCNPENCANMTRMSEFCYCYQNDPSLHVVQKSLSPSKKCSDLNVACSTICVSSKSYFSCELTAEVEHQSRANFEWMGALELFLQNRL